jgi:thioredoxin-like negative regulator of GroEL
MEFTFNTQIVDVSVALNALNLYKSASYKEATTHLLNILDVEPKNWDARLMLGACYFKTEQFASAQRAFRFIYENCPLSDTKSRALEGMQAATFKLQPQKAMPMEFGGYVERNIAQISRLSWID